MLTAVELLPGRRIGQPVVGAAVDHHASGRAARRARADCPCGSARKTTSWPARISGVVASMIRSASGTRCGWCSPSRSPALL